ncbi:MAG: hypothetical protein WDN24_04560 [Sphingomonas sp.]
MGAVAIIAVAYTHHLDLLALARRGRDAGGDDGAQPLRGDAAGALSAARRLALVPRLPSRECTPRSRAWWRR